jgi:hypothetical protein
VCGIFPNFASFAAFPQAALGTAPFVRHFTKTANAAEAPSRPSARMEQLGSDWTDFMEFSI